MPTPFPLTPEESLLWESIRRPFLTVSGEINRTMTDAFAKSALDNFSKINFKSDYFGQLPLLLVFLKNYPDYLDMLLPVIYKVGNKQAEVRDFLDAVQANAPEVLARILPEMFKNENALALQMPLLMDMGRYLEKNVFESLDFKLLLKASPAKLLKAFTPTPVTWDAFMELAKGLVKNDTTKDLAQMIACSVGLQVSTAKSKDEKSDGVEQYDWVDVAEFWREHEWSWNVGETLEIFRLRAKGASLVSDMVYSMVHSDNLFSGKAKEAIDWINIQGLPSTPSVGNSLDNAVQKLYMKTEDIAIKAACLQWFNERAENCSIFGHAWRVMPAEDMVTATRKLVSTVLIPLGATKASLLSRSSDGTRLPGCLSLCGVRIYTLLNHSDLPLGDMNAAMAIILQKWTKEFPVVANIKYGYDYRAHVVTDMLNTIAHDMQEPARQALKKSNPFKQLMLYSAYLKDVNNEEWSKHTFQFMPDLTDKPLAMLSVVYPEHQDAWAKVQQKVLEGTFKREETIQLISKVLFNQDLTMANISSICSAMDCEPELFFGSMRAPSEDAFIPDSFDFSEVSPS